MDKIGNFWKQIKNILPGKGSVSNIFWDFENPHSIWVKIWVKPGFAIFSDGRKSLGRFLPRLFCYFLFVSCRHTAERYVAGQEGFLQIFTSEGFQNIFLLDL